MGDGPLLQGLGERLRSALGIAAQPIPEEEFLGDQIPFASALLVAFDGGRQDFWCAELLNVIGRDAKVAAYVQSSHQYTIQFRQGRHRKVQAAHGCFGRTRSPVV